MDITHADAVAITKRKAALTFSLFAVTIVPIAYYLAVGGWPDTAANFQQFVFVIGVLGVTHVGMTTYFYVGDRRYTAIIGNDKLRYYGLPAVAIAIAFAVFFLAGPTTLFIYFMLHYAWLLWHFNKQNWGILSIFNSSDSLPKLSRGESFFFHSLPFGPIIVTSTIYPQMSEFTAPVATLMKIAGTSLFVVSALGLAHSVLVAKRLNGLTTAAWVALSIVFFLPSVLTTNPSVALAFFAHPLQYIVMMIFLAGFGNDTSKAAPLVRIGGLFTFGLTLWALLWFLNNPLSFDLLGAKLGLALTYGITQWHFIADTGLWKLRNPEVRKNFMDSFGFMFKR